jgi:hypothetical protein
MFPRALRPQARNASELLAVSWRRFCPLRGVHCGFSLPLVVWRDTMSHADSFFPLDSPLRPQPAPRVK